MNVFRAFTITDVKGGRLKSRCQNIERQRNISLTKEYTFYTTIKTCKTGHLCFQLVKIAVIAVTMEQHSVFFVVERFN